MGRDLLIVGSPGLPVRAGQRSLAGRVEAIDRSDRVRAPNDPRAGCRGDTRRGRGRYVSPLLRQHLDDPVTDLFKAHPEGLDDTRANALTLAYQPEQQMLGADMAMPQLARLVDPELDHLLGARGERDLAG